MHIKKLLKKIWEQNAKGICMIIHSLLKQTYQSNPELVFKGLNIHKKYIFHNFWTLLVKYDYLPSACHSFTQLP